MKQSTPSKAELLAEVRHLRLEATALAGTAKPWLKIPGLIVYLDATDAEQPFSLEGRIEILELALSKLKAPTPPASRTSAQGDGK